MSAIVTRYTGLLDEFIQQATPWVCEKGLRWYTVDDLKEFARLRIERNHVLQAFRNEATHNAKKRISTKPRCKSVSEITEIGLQRHVSDMLASGKAKNKIITLMKGRKAWIFRLALDGEVVVSKDDVTKIIKQTFMTEGVESNGKFVLNVQKLHQIVHSKQNGDSTEREKKRLSALKRLTNRLRTLSVEGENYVYADEPFRVSQEKAKARKAESE